MLIVSLLSCVFCNKLFLNFLPHKEKFKTTTETCSAIWWQNLAPIFPLFVWPNDLFLCVSKIYFCQRAISFGESKKKKIQLEQCCGFSTVGQSLERSHVQAWGRLKFWPIHILFSSGMIFSVLFMYPSIPVWFSLFKVKMGEITGAEWL